jgi:ornithine decarboxylase
MTAILTRPTRHRDIDIVARLQAHLDREQPPTPCLVIDLPAVRVAYATLLEYMPAAEIFYAVKANPAPDVVALLAAEGSGFDVASPAEIDLCLRSGASASTISYGNPIKKPRDIAYAYGRGVRRFVSDSEEDLRAIAAHAPGARVMVRIAVDDRGSSCPFGKKFGCPPDAAADLLHLAARLGLTPQGVAFHPGSQQADPEAWDRPVAAAARIARQLRRRGIELVAINIGGGIPVDYCDAATPLAGLGRAIDATLARHFGSERPALMIEPGRSLVATAGLIRSEVVRVTRRAPADDHRWVYLDVGRYGGLAETEHEAIAYPMRTSVDGGPVGPVVIAGPTCDGEDVLYQTTPYALPLALKSGDTVDLLNTGAYTASYSSHAFNGFGPLSTHCVDTTDDPDDWSTR